MIINTSEKCPKLKFEFSKEFIPSYISFTYILNDFMYW